MKITKTKLRQIIKEEVLQEAEWWGPPRPGYESTAAVGTEVYLVTAGYGSTAIGIFSSMAAAEEAVLRDIEYEHREMGYRTVKREDYDIDKYVLDKGRN